MPSLSKQKGFSLIEVLISLIIISLAAVNITGLQNKIAEQQRDNIIHATVITIAKREMENLLSLEDVDDLMAMHDVSITLTEDTVTELIMHWEVTNVDGFIGDLSEKNNNFKQVTLIISWLNGAAEKQSFTYTSDINFGSLLSSAYSIEKIAKIEQTPSIIVSTLI